ncbi:P-loop NTPase fold protein [Pantoea agglomerans]|uniref:KAP family P-loop NTPase fold protein n=1 Tax=Enterobacter agglomerans TaxID=549 RepID=UPI003208DCF4
MRLTASTKDFSEGFSVKDDIFDRKKLHDQIMRVAINAVDKSLVLALDDKWGNGKTSFVKMMESEIKINHSEVAEVIYFDAFKSDYQSDPFVALTANIYAMTEKDINLKSLGDKLLEAGKRLGASFVISGSKFAISAVTAGLVSGTAVEKLGDAISESISSPLEKYIEEKIKSSKEEAITIETFGKILTAIHQESGKKIIFIIDELDRARPDFSLDLLEKIKHIFSVEGVIFLLVVNREQFQKSIESRYGNINSKLYLNKFVHYWFTLPKDGVFTKGSQVGINQPTIVRYLRSIDEHNTFLGRSGVILKVLAGLLEANSCSLREAERCYSVLSIIAPSETQLYVNDTYKTATALIAFLKVHNSILLTEIISKKHNADKVIEALNILDTPFSGSTEYSLIRLILDYHYATDNELSAIRRERNNDFYEIEGGYPRRIDIMKIVYSSVEGFDVNF